MSIGLNMDRLKQRFLRGMAGVRDERHAHPRLDGFLLPADVACRVARTIAEEENGGDRQTEAER